MRTVRYLPDWRAVAAFLRDPSSDWKPKVLAAFAIAYLLWPADLVPDIAPVLGWLDDVGLAGIATWYLIRAASCKRPPSAP